MLPNRSKYLNFWKRADKCYKGFSFFRKLQRFPYPNRKRRFSRVMFKAYNTKFYVFPRYRGRKAIRVKRFFILKKFIMNQYAIRNSKQLTRFFKQSSKLLGRKNRFLHFFNLVERRLISLLLKNQFAADYHDALCLINFGLVKVNGRVIRKPNFLVKMGDSIQVVLKDPESTIIRNQFFTFGIQRLSKILPVRVHMRYFFKQILKEGEKSLALKDNPLLKQKNWILDKKLYGKKNKKNRRYNSKQHRLRVRQQKKIIRQPNVLYQLLGKQRNKYFKYKTVTTKWVSDFDNGRRKILGTDSIGTRIFGLRNRKNGERSSDSIYRVRVLNKKFPTFKKYKLRYLISSNISFVRDGVGCLGGVCNSSYRIKHMLPATPYGKWDYRLASHRARLYESGPIWLHSKEVQVNYRYPSMILLKPTRVTRLLNLRPRWNKKFKQSAAYAVLYFLYNNWLR